MRIGDVCAATLPDGRVRYLQFIARDLTQLNSDVIRVFKPVVSSDEAVSMDMVAAWPIDFHVHCAVSLGVKTGCWKRVGKAPIIGGTEAVIFRTSGDHGNQSVKVSHNWWAWRINEQMVRVGTLKGEFLAAEIGCVLPPQWIIERIVTGRYTFVYPGY